LSELAQLRGRVPLRLFDAWLRRRIGSQPRAQGMGRLPYGVLLREAAARLDDLVTLLGDRPFFYGRRPGVADLAVYGQLRTACRGATPDLHDLIHARTALTDLMERLEERTGGA
jgi:glutathione S-transferase